MKKRTLKRELTLLMMLACACTLLSACAAILYVFFSFFISNTQEDIEYVLKSTSQQFRSHMQFIEDGGVFIRHNTMLDSFFEKGEYDRAEAESQLSYSMELFSERNMIDRQLPFVTSVYLFNSQDDCIYEHYYASTLTSVMEQETRYRSLQQEFKQSHKQYEITVDDNNMNVFFKIYDDDMQEKGICIAEVSREGIENILSGITMYSDSTWGVISGENEVILSYGDQEHVRQLLNLDSVWSGEKSLSGTRIIGCADTYGFSLRTVSAVGQGNVYSILKPTMIIFGFVLLLVLAVTFFVALAVSYRFTKPVTSMIDNIRAFGKQEFDVRMEDSSIQELHDIGTVFNEMAERIKYLIIQVYEKQILATQSQVKYLQAQINPHFQFNILSMLSLKAKLAGNEEIYESLQAFSKLIQGKIFREKEIKIKVSEELEIVSFYLYLQKSRYQDKISYHITVDDEIINQNLIPRLLIEPFVENAVSHGLEPKRGSGMINVHLYESDELQKKDQSVENSESFVQRMLHICVEDDGVGFDTEKVEETNSDTEKWSGGIEHTHTGLENTKRMLQVLYGEQHKFRISGGMGKGTRIEIVIPVERGEVCVENNSGR